MVLIRRLDGVELNENATSFLLLLYVKEHAVVVLVAYNILM